MRRDPHIFQLLPLILFSWIVLIPLSASAAEPSWKVISGKSGKDGILYDPASVMYLSRTLTRVWVRNTPQQRTLKEFHCAYKIVRDVQVVTEPPNKPPQTNLIPSDWRGVVPESPLGELFKKICR